MDSEAFCRISRHKTSCAQAPTLNAIKTENVITARTNRLFTLFPFKPANLVNFAAIRSHMHVLEMSSHADAPKVETIHLGSVRKKIC